MSGKYEYYDASTGTISGKMLCEKCHKKITEGMFRTWISRDGEAYLSEHKECSKQDKQWAILEAQEKSHKEYRNKLLIAAIAFKNQWEVDDLDNLIEELT